MSDVDVEAAIAAWNARTHEVNGPLPHEGSECDSDDERKIADEACALPECHIYREPNETRESAFEQETKRKLHILAEFMNKWKNLPAQRSQQWYDDRTYSVGASEIPTIIGGINPYQTIRSMVATKCGLLTITDKTALNWGCVLERVITMYAENVFDCKIEEMGSIPTARMRGQRSSPDGVAVVPCLGNAIVSFEFKAPKNRIPKGIVPAYYRPQVLTCLCAVEPSDLGIFIDVVFRRCSRSQWDFDREDYDTTYHKDIEFGKPHALTMLYFFDVEGAEPSDVQARLARKKAEEANATNTLPIPIFPVSEDELADGLAALTLKNTPNETIDMGTCHPMIFDDMFSRVTEKKMRVEYGRVFMPGDPIPDFAAESARFPGCAGILPLKIMRCSIVPVKKEPDYVLQFQPLIDQIIDTVRIVLAAPKEQHEECYKKECDARGWTKMPYNFHH